MKRLLLALGLVLATAVPALAQPARPPAGPVDPYADRADAGPRAGKARAGKARAGKARAGKARMKRALVTRFDQDGDGRLTGPERQAARRFVKQQRAERRLRALQRLDADRDGWLSPEEQRRARR